MGLLVDSNTKVMGLIFDLPTSIVCKDSICSGCYSIKSEKRFPNVLKKRIFNYEASKKSSFVEDITIELNKSKKKVCRLHSSGDFFSQEYIDKWIDIVTKNTNTTFYCYTKRLNKFDFSKLNKLNNINIINSITPLGINYGNIEYCNTLVKEYNYKLCPCANDTVDKKTKCLVECNYCSIKGNDKVVFKKH